MKPKKRIKMMVAGIFGLPKDSILTYNGAAGYYFDKDDKAYRKTHIHDLGETLAQQISADGYTLEELKYKDCEVYNPVDDSWKPYTPTTKLINFHFVRLKSVPEFKPVPESVKLNINGWRGFIFNNARSLCLDDKDRLPVMGKFDYTPQPHQIDPRELTEFEDGQIYFGISGSKNEYVHKDDIGFYGVYCKKLNNIYFFADEIDYAIESIEAETRHLEYYRKVIPCEVK